jgi:hypothetical protein
VGAKAKTVMIACIAPNQGNCEHTLNTLRYADRVKEHDATRRPSSADPPLPQGQGVAPASGASRSPSPPPGPPHPPPKRVDAPLPPRRSDGGGAGGGGVGEGVGGVGSRQGRDKADSLSRSPVAVAGSLSPPITAGGGEARQPSQSQPQQPPLTGEEIQMYALQLRKLRRITPER